MFKDHTAYEKGLKRINFLRDLEASDRLTLDTHEELRQLEVAVAMFEDFLEPETKGEHDFMVEFEDRFLASQYR
jgi:hypothetical protein